MWQLFCVQKISEYQYILKSTVETKISDAEKFYAFTLETVDYEFMTDEITVYGIEPDSRYISKDIPAGKVLVSNGYADKFALKDGDEIILKEQYTDKTYSFEVGGIYTYDAGLIVLMNTDDYLAKFDVDEDDFNGYFSDVELDDIDESKVYSVITEQDMLKISNQLEVSIGSFMGIFKMFGIIMFVLLMFILTKQIIVIFLLLLLA